MNLKMIRTKTELEVLLLLIKISETNNKQTHRKLQETLEFRLPNQEKHFILIHLYHFKVLGS